MKIKISFVYTYESRSAEERTGNTLLILKLEKQSITGKFYTNAM